MATRSEDPVTAPSFTGVDAARWPDIAHVPHAPVRGAIARLLFRYATRRAGVNVRSRAQRGETPAFIVVDGTELYSRLGTAGLIGFGEAWMSGAWDSDDPPAVLTSLAEHLTSLVPRPLQRLRSVVDRSLPWAENADRDGARRNVARHYDLSNDMFATFLDPTMTYSSAVFGPGDDLEHAQLRKIDSMLDLAGVGAGTRLLEIGCGWGTLAIRAAQRGARVTAVTLSEEQRSYAAERIRAAGLAGQVEIRLQDYRDVEGSYPAIVSVEMIEAVGERHWPDYFGTLRRLLAPGGRVGLQSILMPHDHMLATRRTWTWMHKYIFPGGLIPSATAIGEHAGRDGGLRVTSDHRFGHDYARTLRAWRENFLAARDRLAELGFDDTFCRMWEFYLAYCEAGFRAGRIDVAQLRLEAL